MNFVENDGGRSNYFHGKDVGSCAVRAIAIATNSDYKDVYDALKYHCYKDPRYRDDAGEWVRKGTPWPVIRKYLENDLGWVCVNKPKNQKGKPLRLGLDKLDKRTYIIGLEQHLTCVKKGDTIYDVYDPSISKPVIEVYWIKQNKKRS